MADTSLNTLPAEFQEVATICAATEVVIGGRTVIGIDDARKLHQGLNVGRAYTNWIKDRIEKYGFREGVDFEVASTKESCVPDLAGKIVTHGGHNAVVYRLTLDTAKELAMVENNEVGRVIRRYFIWAENRQQQITALTAKETGGIVKAVVGKILAELKGEIDAEMVDQRKAMLELSGRVDGLIIASDPRRAVEDRLSVRQLLDQSKCHSKGRNGVNRRIGNAMKHAALTAGTPGLVKKCPHTGVWLYESCFANEFMRTHGNAWVADHNATIIGQGTFNFAKEKAKRRPPASENPDAPL